MSSSTTQVDGADLISLLESTDVKVVDEVTLLINDNLQSAKEPWLLNGLVDSYMVSNSAKVLDILIDIQEPHDQHLFDRILDHMKVDSNKLQSLNLLAHIIVKQASWLHKLTKHSLLTYIVKTMKLHSDVPVLMSCLLTVTMLLPHVPVLITPFLSDIFDAFSRLITFCRKKPSNIPDTYLLHLQVAIYSLFHRLYGMYPCNFLTYLRQVYSKADQKQAFEESVKPMLDKVKMHPLLVTASKEKETTKERWRRKEVHDILVDCAQLSLDPTEGSEQGEYQTSIQAQPSKILTPKEFTTDVCSQSVKVKPKQLSEKPPLLSAEKLKNQFFSPSLECGLSTPPPALSSAVQSQQTFEFMLPSVTPTSQLSVPGNTPVPGGITTPNAMLESPYPPSSTEKSKSPQAVFNQSTDNPSADNKPDRFFVTPDMRPGSIQKQKSGTSLTVNTSRPLDATMMTTEADSVPPSPLKPDFSSQSPLHTPKSQAQRKISFDYNKPDNKDLSSSSSSRTGDKEGDCVSSSSSASRQGSIPSVKQLSQFIDSLDVESDAPDKDEDQEVSDLTRDATARSSSESENDCPSHLPADLNMTAESVKAFMKKVNRIKFNSMNIQQDVKSKIVKVSRSNSCPDLAETDSSASEDVKHSNRPTPCEEESSTRSRSSTNPENTVSHTVTTKITSMTTTTTMSASILQQAEIMIEQKRNQLEARYPYLRLIPEVFPFLPPTVNRKYDSDVKAVNSEESSGNISMMPDDLHSNSPVHLLDQHLQLGSDVHSKELSHLSLTSTGKVNWTHFGGMPPADEISILRGQIKLLHNQLLFERNKREIHAKRNRRLLGRIAKTAALEEQSSAMSEQIRLLENDIQNHLISMKLQQDQYVQLKNEKERTESKMTTEQKSLRESLCRVEENNKDLSNQVITQSKVTQLLQKELKSIEAKLFTVQKQLEFSERKATRSSGLQQQVNKLNRELLLMGELQQKYQQRLLEVGKTQKLQPQTKFMVDTLKGELSAAKSTASQRLIIMDSSKNRLSEAEELIKQKDTVILELKRSVENLKSKHRCHIDALEEKYRSQKSIQLGLQAQILDLHNKMSRLQRPTAGESAPLSDELVRKSTAARRSSPSTHSISSAEMGDEATALIETTSPTGSLTLSASSAFEPYQRSDNSKETSPEHANNLNDSPK